MQERVCLQLHARYSPADTAGHIGVAPSTVPAGVRKIHVRLDLHSIREQDAFVKRLVDASEGRDRA